jgi:cytokinesis protein
MAKFSQRQVDDIVKLIIHCEPEILDNNVVMDFLQRDELCNIPDNVAKLMAPYSKDWTGPNAMTTQREQDPSELTRPDQLYLYTAFELHHYWKARMRALALTRSYEADYDEISSKIRDIVNVSNSLRDSVTLLNVMSFILLIGNFMNEPNKQAAGFKISSLTRLGMVKDAANETTFLDFVERSVRNKWSEWDNFADDISAVTTTQKINVDQLIQDAKKYIENIKNVQASLDSGNLSDPKRFHPDDRVALVAQRCMKEARRKAEQLSLFLEEMTSTYNEIMAFFGEDPTDENERRNFLANFADFVRDWKVRVTSMNSQVAVTNIALEIKGEERWPGRDASPERSLDEAETTRARCAHRRDRYSAITLNVRCHGRFTRQTACREAGSPRPKRPPPPRETKRETRGARCQRPENARHGRARQPRRRGAGHRLAQSDERGERNVQQSSGRRGRGCRHRQPSREPPAGARRQIRRRERCVGNAAGQQFAAGTTAAGERRGRARAETTAETAGAQRDFGGEYGGHDGRRRRGEGGQQGRGGG